MMKTISLKNFLGINNRVPDTALRVATSQLNGQHLKDAVDVDIDNSGNCRSRLTETLVQAMSGAHSVFMITDTTGLVVRDSVLYAITLPTYSETIVKLLSVNTTMNYEMFNGDVYCSNGVDSGRVASNVWYPWGMQTPDEPVVAIIGGSLDPANYQVSVSYRNNVTGEEGGISQSNQVTLSSIGGIRVTLPSAVAGATHVCVYISGPNGGVGYFSTAVPVGASTYDIVAQSSGYKAPQRYEAPLPPGKPFMSNGRLCTISGSKVYIGLAFRLGYYEPSRGYISFPTDVTHAVENMGGTYICTATETHWFPGDLGNVEGVVQEPLPFGAVSGTGFVHPKQPVVGWFSSRGFVLGDASGQVSAKMSENVELTAPQNGVSAVCENEFLRVASCGWCMNLDTGVATRYSDWALTSVSRGYGTKSDGIYRLWQSGSVVGMIDFGNIDFGVENRKHMPYCYVGMQCETALELRVRTPDGDDYSYPTEDFGDLEVRRVEVGRGLRSNWFNLSISNPDASPFKIASLSFAPALTKRRIK